VRRTRILVADSLEVFRLGVRNLLLRDSEFDVVEAASLDEIEQLEQWPDLALIDADLPLAGALAAIALLAERCDAVTIVWGFDPDRAQVLNAIRAGAHGYLHREMSGAGLVRALHGAVQGEAPLTRNLVTLMVNALHGLEERERATERLRVLSRRERQVLDLIAGGEQLRDIAEALEISEFTVRRHVQNILHKLDLRSRVAAASFYRQAVGPPDLVGARQL
jgi:two-component system nitrate/nitrite response regulator NarL